MKRLISIGIFVLVTAPAFCQEDSGTEGGSGGMGYFQAGMSFRLPNNLGTELNGFLRELEDYPQVGLLLGGGGFGRLGSKLILGGNGGALIYPTVDGTNSNVKLAGGGGTLNIGWTMIESSNYFGFPFIGIGAFAYGMEVENLGPLVNQGRFYINPSETLKINSELLYLDLGFNVFRFLFPSGGSGPVVGVSVGYMQKIWGTEWETSEGFNLDNLSDPELSTFYLKICLGGGGGFN